MARISKFLGITPRELMERHGEVMWNRIPGTRAFILSLGLAFPCGFLSGGGCRIYQVRPLGCRLFPEAPALRDDADLSLYLGSGYPCFDRGVSVPPTRAERVGRLLRLQRKESRETAEMFRSDAYIHMLAPAELEAVARELEGVPPAERNARRRELCLARIPTEVKERARRKCVSVLLDVEWTLTACRLPAGAMAWIER
jgi:Fe-S-cluster containining protein